MGVVGPSVADSVACLRPGPAPRGPGHEGGRLTERARPVRGVNYRLTVATTTLHQLTQQGPDQPVGRVVGHREDRRALDTLPKAR